MPRPRKTKKELIASGQYREDRHGDRIDPVAADEVIRFLVEGPDRELESDSVWQLCGCWLCPPIRAEVYRRHAALRDSGELNYAQPWAFSQFSAPTIPDETDDRHFWTFDVHGAFETQVLELINAD